MQFNSNKEAVSIQSTMLSVYIVTDRMRAAGHLFLTPGLQPAPFAFHCALAARARSRLTGCPSITEGRRLTLEAGHLKDLPAVLVLSAIISVIPQIALGK